MTEEELGTITKFAAKLIYKRQPPKTGTIPLLWLWQEPELYYYIMENGPDILRHDSHMQNLFIQIYLQIAKEMFAINHQMGWQQKGDLPPKETK